MAAQKTDINDEVLQSSTGVDMKLHTVQTGMSKAALSMVSAMKGLVDYQAPLKRQPIGDIALDTKYHSGQYLKQVRRDLLKPHIIANYQVLCKPKSSVDTSQWLFGTVVAERIKSATQGSKISKKG